jgi:hypothetical protein
VDLRAGLSTGEKKNFHLVGNRTPVGQEVSSHFSELSWFRIPKHEIPPGISIN